MAELLYNYTRYVERSRVRVRRTYGKVEKRPLFLSTDDFLEVCNVTYHKVYVWSFQHMGHLKVVESGSSGPQVQLGGQCHQTFFSFDVCRLLTRTQFVPEID